MKSVAIILLSVIYLFGCNQRQKTEKEIITDFHNSLNSLDWEGTYSGILPCADCAGIQTLIKLNKNLTFLLQSKYLGKEDTVFETKGTFSWDKSGNKIILNENEIADSASQYLVGENTLTKLDLNGNKITGGLAQYYILQKERNEITN